MKTKTNEEKDRQGQDRSTRPIAILLLTPNPHRVCQYTLARRMEHFLRRPQTDRPSWIVYSESNSNVKIYSSLGHGALLKNLFTNAFLFLQGLPILGVFFYGSRDPGGLLKGLLTNVFSSIFLVQERKFIGFYWMHLFQGLVTH